MKFKYTALSPANQKIEGVLTAASLTLAQEELHKMGFSIIALNETREQEERVEPKKEGVLTFFFRGTDPEGKTMEGTIEAKTDENAYHRLLIDYRFKVETFYPLNATEVEKQALIPKKQEWDALFRPEGPALKKASSEEVTDPELLKEIDSVIQKSKEVLSAHRALFKAETLKTIEERLGDLQRIRTSNNLRHIAEVSSRLLELIRTPDAAPESRPGSAFQKSIQALEDNTLFKENLSRYEKKLRLSGIRFILNQIKKKWSAWGLFKKSATPAPALFSSTTPTGAPAPVPARSGFKKVAAVLYSYLKAPNAVTKNIRKNELLETWNEFKNNLKKKRSISPDVRPEKKPSHDFAEIFLEIDSFVTWLLSFYLLYFLLVSFSLEKRVGIPVEWVARTLRSSLLLDLASVLLVTHFLLTLKLKKFHQNFWGSFFLFTLGYGLLALLLFNF